MKKGGKEDARGKGERGGERRGEGMREGEVEGEKGGEKEALMHRKGDGRTEV